MGPAVRCAAVQRRGLSANLARSRLYPGTFVGQTNTMPLYIEVLYNDYAFAASFAVASLLTLIAFVTLGLKAMLEWRAEWRLASAVALGECLRIEVRSSPSGSSTRSVLDRINLEIREKEFLGLLGPSGSGKTTLLRILAGLEFADGGGSRSTAAT